MKRAIKILAFVALAFPMIARAATIADVEQMIESGEEVKALAVLDSIAKSQPKNPAVYYDMGLCYQAIGRDDSAVKAFNEARAKGSLDAIYALAELAQRTYRLDDAANHLSDLREALAKNPDKRLSAAASELAQRVNRTRSMLDRVENIVVIDSITVNRNDFFRAYKLSPESGTLNSFSILPDDLEFSLPTVVYRTEDGREMLWAAEDENGLFTLRSSNLLADGTWEPAERVGNHLGGNGDANYPFLMPDGVTLYFASDNDESIGGYDIFMSRYDGDSFLQPSNVGMPYNSPYDDYMMAIDEVTGIGWWASDRNRLGNKVTIYLFVPEEMRVNVSVDDPNLINRALIKSIKDTWRRDEIDPKLMLNRLANIRPVASHSAGRPAIEFALPDGRVITEASQLTNEHAREMFERYTYKLNQVNVARNKLASLRQHFAAGEKEYDEVILELEQAVEFTSADLRRISNDIIRTEIGQ